MEHTATVLITTKSRKDELRTALNSCLLQQTTEPVEILVINDGSEDGTGDMVAAEFPSVRLINHESSAGLVQRRNEGTFEAKGSVIFSIDDDAEFTSPAIIEDTLKEFADPCIGAVAIPFCNVNQGEEIFQKAPDQDEVYLTHAFRGTAYAVRKDIFAEVGGYRPYFIHQGEEGDLCLRMFDKGYYVRVGSSDVINHYESPRRSFFRMDCYGRRNDVLATHLNTPLRYLPLHMIATIVNGVRHGIKVGRLMNMVRGLFAGGWACIRYGKNRAPVSKATYQSCRTLKRCGLMKMSEVIKP